MLQLLDLARKNAALRREVTQLRQEAEALRRLPSQPCPQCSRVDSSGSDASEDAGAPAMKAWIVTCDSCPYREHFLTPRLLQDST